MMGKRILTFLFIILLLGVGWLKSVVAADEVEHILQKTITSAEPEYLTGREGDPTAIKGYTISFDIFLDGTQVGTGTSEVTVLDPPVNFDNQYSHAIIEIENTLPGIGSFTVTAHAVNLGSSTTPTAGDAVNAWAGSISNGTESLENAFGLSSGTGVVNIFAGTGEMTEVLRIRTGF